MISDLAVSLRRLVRRLISIPFNREEGGADLYAVEDDIRHAYRLLLGREPDPEGFGTYKKKIAKNRILASDLADFFLGSEEFAIRHSEPVRGVDLEGYVLFVKRSDLDVGKPLVSGVGYEPNVSLALRQVLCDGQVFVDIGANVGYYTALAATLVGERGRVVAVEPLDKNLQLIFKTVLKNKFDNISVVPFAASDKSGILSISTMPGSSNGEIVLGSKSSVEQSLHALSVRLDDVILGLTRLDAVKVDVEGHELHALRGFDNNIEKFRPLIFSEFHPKCMRELSHISPEDYYSHLVGYGGAIDVLNIDGGRTRCNTFAELMKAWVMTGELLDVGDEAHLDLLVTLH